MVDQSFLPIFPISLTFRIPNECEDEIDKKEKAIYYMSKKFTEYNSKYSSLEKICYALAWTTKRLKQYMLYYIDRAIDDYKPMKLNFSNDELMAISRIKEDNSKEKIWRMYFDGTANAMRHGINAILISPIKHYYPVTTRLNFNCTNNVIEYKAYVMGQHVALDKKIKMLKMFEDSTLVIYQLKDEWKTRYSKLILYHKYILKLCKQFKAIQFEHLPREENQITNALTTLAIMVQNGDTIKIQPIKLNIKDMPVHCAKLKRGKRCPLLIS
ncbi:uncharacterized protein LOC111298324 [Durio zibethinus]|uniref:Uncharacterized protein LOC111298324 n=1 Tax=Durio zibethinus TaxID=66656 RepID=A0A6P5Z8S6_DURZI|nr:uncharacterized protein LOC111298324 [Durio zibethinus]